MCLLMEEECPQDNQQDSTHQQPQGKTALNFSVSYTKLASTYSYLGGRHWKDIVFSPSSNNVLLMMLSSPASPSWSGINSKGILCLWNTREPAKPERCDCVVVVVVVVFTCVFAIASCVISLVAVARTYIRTWLISAIL